MICEATRVERASCHVFYLQNGIRLAFTLHSWKPSFLFSSLALLLFFFYYLIHFCVLFSLSQKKKKESKKREITNRVLTFRRSYISAVTPSRCHHQNILRHFPYYLVSPTNVSKHLDLFSSIGGDRPDSDSGDPFYSYRGSANFDYDVITFLFGEDSRLLIFLLVFMI